MREHGLQAPNKVGTERGPRVHEDSIIPSGPNQMWGTDATQVHSRLEGMATTFEVVDHFVGDVVGIHAARPGTRFEALEPSIWGSIWPASGHACGAENGPWTMGSQVLAR